MPISVRLIAKKVFFITLLLVQQTLLGETAVWSGTQDCLWTNPGNWISQCIPIGFEPMTNGLEIR